MVRFGARRGTRSVATAGWGGLLVGLLAVAGTWPAPVFANARSQALYAKGLVPFHTERWEDAYRLFVEAAQADPQDALAVYYRGLSAAKLGRLNAAREDIERALQLRPDLPGAALDLGILHFDAHEYDRAEPWLERAYQQPPDRFMAALFRGLIRFRLGDDAEARRFLDEAAKDPELRPAAHYYAALARLRQGETQAARAGLAAVQAERPDSEVARVAGEYLRGVPEARRPPAGVVAARPWSAYGGLGFEYDSNVVLAPDDSEIKATRSISRQQDGRAVLGVGGRYRVVENERVRATLAYDLSQSVHFRLTDFDLQAHRVRMDVATPPERIQYGLTGVYDFYALNYQTFFQQGFGTPWVTFFVGETAATQVFYTLRGRDFFRKPFEPFRDSINHAAGVRQFFLLGAVDRLLAVGYQFDDEDSVSRRGGEFEYQGHQVDLSLEFAVREWARATLGYLFRLEDYESPNSRTATASGPGRRRHDREHEFIVHLERSLTPQLTANLTYLGVVNDSNIAPFDYDRNIVSAGVRFRFQ